MVNKIKNQKVSSNGNIDEIIVYDSEITVFQGRTVEIPCKISTSNRVHYIKLISGKNFIFDGVLSANGVTLFTDESYNNWVNVKLVSLERNPDDSYNTLAESRLFTLNIIPNEVSKPININYINDITCTSGIPFDISYTTSRDAIKHELSFDNGNSFVNIYPSGGNGYYQYNHEQISQTSYKHSRQIRVTDSNGNTATSNIFYISVLEDKNSDVLKFMYPMPQPHEVIPNGAPQEWKYISRWEDRTKPYGWKAFGGWAQVYRIEGSPFSQNTGVEIKDYCVYGWKNGQWNLVTKLAYPSGNFFAEDFKDDKNSSFPNSLKVSNDYSSVTIRLTPDMTLNTSDGTKYVNYHPFTSQLDYDVNFEYIFTCVSMRKVKWNNYGIDDRNVARYCASCGGDWWREKGLSWAPDWTNNKGIAQPKITEVTNDWKKFCMTTVPEYWTNGFPI